jgi:3-dehydroquinate dehydratase II
MPTPFSWAGGARKNRLISDFHGFHTGFYELDEAFGLHSGSPEGFPLAAMLPITPRPALPLSAGIRMAQGSAQASAATIYVLNGPNLNMLGTREPETYGHATLADVEKLCVETAAQFGLKADCRQSNREGELIDFIHEAHAKKVVGIVINAGGYSHTSIALHDALNAVKIPTVEVHVSNIHARESFRHHSYTAMAAFASLCGFGIDGYRLAISGLAAKIGAKAKS